VHKNVVLDGYVFIPFCIVQNTTGCRIL